ncbi:hypothetical protein CVT24_004137 [Panaeolus cyanescens]|uniref:Uncharacterized protein n=1 Tax=Panaeolus cyanescens TaxID=181874 RepID=A0A409Y689_9AGAR|nr:hypothetical protein CVT24_004137 [Panaeolus cyanescens]
MSSVFLPSDIFHVVFGLLSNEAEGPDVQTLSACCLASSEIGNICEAYLYACIHIVCGEGHASLDRKPGHIPQCAITVRQLKATLSRRPYINRFIRTLGFYWRRPNAAARQELCEFMERIQPHNVQTLYISSSYIVSWNQVDVPVQTFFYSLLESPNLRRLEVSNLDDFPLHIAFQPQPQIRSLGMSMLLLANVPGVSTGDYILPWMTKSITLESLFLGGLATDLMTDTLIRWRRADGEPLFDFSAISKLSVTLSFVYFDRDLQLTHGIITQSKNLRYISLHGTRIFRFKQALTLTGVKVQTGMISEMLSGALQQTKNTLEVLALIMYPNATSPLGNLPEFLSFDGCTFASLRCIKIQLYVYRNIEGELPNDGAWSRLADVLADKEKFPMLEKVEIWMKFNGWPEEPRDMIDIFLSLGHSMVEGQFRDRGVVFKADYFTFQSYKRLI